MSEPLTWEEACKEDEKYREFLSVVQERYPTAYLKEVMDTLSHGYKDRMIRAIKTRQLIDDAQEKLVQILLENQQLRSVITEHKGDVYANRARLENYADKMTAYLKIKYATLFKVFKNEAMRSAAIENLFSGASSRLQRMDSFLAFCDERIKDIDQEKWAVKSIIDAMQINQAVGGHI